MKFNDHSKLVGRHALLSPSNWHWIRYAPDERAARLESKIASDYATTIGTAVHELAADHIKFGIKVAKSEKKELLLHLLKAGIPWKLIDIDWLFTNYMHYINDSIGFNLLPEVPLCYSEEFCFGTADSIQFSEKENKLRIFDLKTGKTPAHFEQLYIYAALFCLEYNIKPSDIEFELRIYQADEMLTATPGADVIAPMMETIIADCKYLAEFKEE